MMETDNSTASQARATETEKKIGSPEKRPVTLITGASEGIGRALALQFAHHEHDLLLLARSHKNLEMVTDEIQQLYPVRVFILPCDLLEADSLEKLQEFVAENNLFIDILINNAGVGLAGAFTMQDRQRLLDMHDLNMRCATELMHMVLPEMLARNNGGIINIASLGAFIPGPYQAGYYASKSYLVSLTRAVRAEHFFSKVRIATVLPGPVDTGFHKRMGSDGAFYPEAVGCMQASTVAWYTYWGYVLRLTLIIPGIRNIFYALALKFIPHAVMMPFMGWILKRRLKRA